MNILLVYPETPSTFWSFKEALNFVSKKSAEPPLGLITVAALLPKEWKKRLIDLNVSKMKDEDILWADYLFLSGMNVQAHSFKDVIRRANKLGVKVIAGGPYATTQFQDILGVDHFILNEGEVTIPLFLEDLKNGVLKHVYRSDEFPPVQLAPVPMWELLDMKKYASMSIQYSRGCPYDCEFCSITMLNGRKVRAKSKEQFFNELDALYKLGWRGGVSIVDDNFIGNKRKLKDEILPELKEWQLKRKYPFNFITEVTITVADDDELMQKMIDAAVHSIFIGIETPDEASLTECGKKQNMKKDLIHAVKKLQKNGMIVSGGFIVGFDNDSSDTFDKQIAFIKESGIVSAMVGLLNAPTGTKLYNRLQKENRLLEQWSGNNMDGATNIIPKMSYSELIKGYSRIIDSIYAPKAYYERVKLFLSEYKLPVWKSQKLSKEEITAFLKLLWRIGIMEKGKKYFWKMFFYSILKYPKKFSTAMTFAVYGFHFRRIAERI
jgi:radical SAM superfamily enzyme YgiQ (UPF0313 family)